MGKVCIYIYIYIYSSRFVRSPDDHPPKEKERKKVQFAAANLSVGS